VAYVKTAGLVSIDAAHTLQEMTGGWKVVSFVAQRPQHLLSVGVASDTELAPGETLEVTVDYVRVDYVSETVEFDEPDQSAPAMRTLYEVTLLDGPRVVRTYPPRAGSLEEVSF